MKGRKLIKSQIDDIPDLPGIYRMLNNKSYPIYIGKAKNLKNRLKQYTLELLPKNQLMIDNTYYLDYNITDSESSALLLEAQLIKKFKPKYNILLKDDKSFPYIMFKLEHQYPQLIKYRGRNLSNGKFFGPFASAKEVELTLVELQKIFKLRSCSDNYFNSRKRPCLQYQIKRCCAPCVGKISKLNYDELVKQVEAFLEGKNTKLQKLLSNKMDELSSNLQFEDAAEIRDRIKALSYVQLKKGFKGNPKSADVVAAAKKK